MVNGVIEACVGVAATAAFFGLALLQLRGLRRDLYGGVSNRFLIGLPGPETDTCKPQHTEYVVGSEEDRQPETELRIVLPKDKPYDES
jgi:hypothetical protein